MYWVDIMNNYSEMKNEAKISSCKFVLYLKETLKRRIVEETQNAKLKLTNTSTWCEHNLLSKGQVVSKVQPSNF